MVKTVDAFETDLREWEQTMMEDLTNNRQSFNYFRDQVGNSLEKMSKSVNEKYRMTREYQETVLERMSQLEDRVYKPPDIKQ